MIDGLIVAYGVMCLTLVGVRMALAQVYRIRLRSRAVASAPRDPLMGTTVSIIYPVYNEAPDVLQRVMERIRHCLKLPHVEVIVVDDGSANRAELRPLYEQYTHPRLRILYQENKGKRGAQYAGLSLATGEFIVTVDSDTLIDPDGLRRLIAPLRQDERIGAVCGEVVVENSRTNLLTRLIHRRYWIAFNLERAAQSLFRSVLCCSGPFSAYRASVLNRVKEAYVRQRFRGRLCSYGDDRHLTNLVLGEDFHVVYQPGAIAATFVPETLGEYIKQQNRWNKSFYREMLWTLKIADRVHPYSLADMLLQALLFVGYTLALSRAVFLVVTTGDLTILVFYLAALVTMASVRAVYGLLCTRDWGFLLFLLYGCLHVLVLIPVRFQSLLTLTDNDWGTRASRAVSPWYSFAFWAAGYCAILLTIAASMILLLADTGLASAGGEAFWTVADEYRFRGLAVAASDWLAGIAIALGGLIGGARYLSRRHKARAAPTFISTNRASAAHHQRAAPLTPPRFQRKG